MIFVRLMGGLGNQMFQYAFGRALAIRYKTELVLDKQLLMDKSADHAIVTHRDFDLDIFNNLSFRWASEKEIFEFNGDPKANWLKRLGRRIRTTLSPKKLVIQKNNEFSERYMEVEADTCFVGRWQSLKYFENAKDQVIKDFDLKKPDIKGIDEILNSIKSTTSVCLHVRRRDLVSSPLYSKLIGALSIDYYKTAVQLVLDKLQSPTFFVFSDDLDWCRLNLNLYPNTVFVEESLSGKKAEGHLYLMSECKHFIISNSTFAWWGAFLAANGNKIVVYPKNWNLESSLENNTMCPKDWLAV
jgi:hypothetical protein